MKNFKEFLLEKDGSIENYPSPEYIVQPHAGEKGFFMFKSQFDVMKSKKKKDKNKFTPHIMWKFADED